MMKKNTRIILFTLLIFVVTSTFAQTANQIAFLNSNEILEAMPEKVEATQAINDLNREYKDELTLMQNDYNKKYTDFMSYQNSMAEGIRLRRMQELYELENQLNGFMKVAQEDISNKERELLVPLRLRLKDAINKVGIERGFICIYDLANPAIAFVTPDATDITPLVKQKLGIKQK